MKFVSINCRNSVPTCHVHSVVDGSSSQTKQGDGQSGSFYHLPGVLSGVENLGGVEYFTQSAPACDQVVLGFKEMNISIINPSMMT